MTANTSDDNMFTFEGFDDLDDLDGIDDDDVDFDTEDMKYPENMESPEDKKSLWDKLSVGHTKQNKAIKGMFGDNTDDRTLKDSEREANKQMHRIRNTLLMFAAGNSAIKAHQRHSVNKLRNQYEKATMEATRTKSNGQFGRTVDEIIAEENARKLKKKYEKMISKHPELQRPTSFRQTVNAAKSTISQGVKEALRAQTMKGVAQGSRGSDMRAIQAASVAGFVPESGTGFSNDSIEF